MPQTCILVAEPYLVEARLAELGLTSDLLRHSVRAGMLERLACSDYDPTSARGYELWRVANRTLRELAIQGADPEWRKVDERNQPLIVNPLRRVAVTASSGNEQTGNGDVSRPPTTKNPKGQVTSELVIANEQAFLFPQSPSAIRTPRRSERATWLLLIWPTGSEARCELSLPRAMSKGYIVGWHERLMLEPVALDEEPVAISPAGPSDGDDLSRFDVPVTRRRGA